MGLLFPQKGRFRSEVLVQFAPPVPLTAEDAAAEDGDSDESGSDDDAGKSGEVVTLDSFRKK